MRMFRFYFIHIIAFYCILKKKILHFALAYAILYFTWNSNAFALSKMQLYYHNVYVKLWNVEDDGNEDVDKYEI